VIGYRLPPSRRRPRPWWRPSQQRPRWWRPRPHPSPRRGWRRRHNRSILLHPLQTRGAGRDDGDRHHDARVGDALVAIHSRRPSRPLRPRHGRLSPPAATDAATAICIERPRPGHRLSASSTEKASTTRDPTSMSSTAGSHPRWLPLRAPPAGSICCDSRHNFQRLGSICYGRGCTFRIPCNCDAAFVSSVRPRDQAKGWAYGGLPFFPLGPQQFT
jgi:hypothetical protein